ncbi:hypothetical protein N7452_009798 [Penicillium brevicompactum]|uniref:Uncharacterized protein n=1 Tax=Penicillium brevicompactum TaxID=5074 RepID=A0A9W9QC96_PENBR|nr:hypothetical protein N7452_009798 [Penicillium brevicompactum]
MRPSLTQVCSKYKAWKLNGLHAFVAVLFTAGYAVREAGAFYYIYNKHDERSLIFYITNQVLIYIGPPLSELGNYHILGRVFAYIPWLSPFAPEKVFTIFGSLMGLVEGLNGLGVAFTSNPTGNKQEIGKILVLASLGVQLCVIISFFALATLLYVRYRKANIANKAISTVLNTLYMSMSLILIRSIYRVVEHAGNTSMDLGNEHELQSLSPIMRYEWYFYVFEATTMLLNSILWNVFHPGRFLPTDKSFLSEDGVTEMIFPKDLTHQRLSLTQLGRFIMQILTFGLWSQIFPNRPPNPPGALDGASFQSNV